jgi:hypothetical protein
MDPLSIVAAVAGTLGSVYSTSIALSQFIEDARDTPKEIDAACRELHSLAIPLTQLKEMWSDPSSYKRNKNPNFPRELAQDLHAVLKNCNKVVDEIESLVGKYSAGRFRSMQWAFSGKSQMAQAKSRLETHKSTLVLVISLQTK